MMYELIANLMIVTLFFGGAIIGEKKRAIKAKQSRARIRRRKMQAEKEIKDGIKIIRKEYEREKARRYQTVYVKGMGIYKVQKGAELIQ